MRLSDAMQIDIADTFLGDAGFSKSITYTPSGGTSKTIRAIIDPAVDSEFANAAEVHNYDLQKIIISSLNDTDGHKAPAVSGRNSSGDKVTLPNVSVEYWVKKILEDGRDSGSGMHTLLIASIQAPIRG